MNVKAVWGLSFRVFLDLYISIDLQNMADSEMAWYTKTTTTLIWFALS